MRNIARAHSKLGNLGVEWRTWSGNTENRNFAGPEISQVSQTSGPLYSSSGIRETGNYYTKYVSKNGKVNLVNYKSNYAKRRIVASDLENLRPPD